jgi:hypothetical protein
MNYEISNKELKIIIRIIRKTVKKTGKLNIFEILEMNYFLYKTKIFL